MVLKRSQESEQLLGHPGLLKGLGAHKSAIGSPINAPKGTQEVPGMSRGHFKGAHGLDSIPCWLLGCTVAPIWGDPMGP